MTLADLQERLLAWATAPERQPRLLAARAAHFGRRGEPHEEDKSYESRMTGMLDDYLFDYREVEEGPTTLDLFLAAEGPGLTREEQVAYRALGATRRGLFEVLAVAPGTVRLRDAFSDEEVDVTERRHVAGLSRGDLLEARLEPLEGQYHFSNAFLYQPREARGAILGEVRRLRRAAGRHGRPDVDGFLATLSRMAFKLERYRNVRLESIYDFAAGAAPAGKRPRR